MCSNATGRKRGVKMKIRKVLISLVACFTLSCFIHVTVARADELVSDGKAAVLIEAQTGNVLYEKNATIRTREYDEDDVDVLNPRSNREWIDEVG